MAPHFPLYFSPWVSIAMGGEKNGNKFSRPTFGCVDLSESVHSGNQEVIMQQDVFATVASGVLIILPSDKSSSSGARGLESRGAVWILFFSGFFVLFFFADLRGIERFLFLFFFPPRLLGPTFSNSARLASSQNLELFFLLFTRNNFQDMKAGLF